MNSIETDDKFPDNYKYALTTDQVVQNLRIKSEKNKVGLVKLLQVKIGNRDMLTVKSHAVS